MPIKSIAQREFNKLLPYHLVLENFMGEQIEWFANQARSLIGTIALTKVGMSWNFAVLKRNQLGHFQVCDLEENFFNLRQTMIQFTQAMAAAGDCRHEGYLSTD